MSQTEFVLEKLTAAFPELTFTQEEFRGDVSFSLPKNNIVEVCDFLKNTPELGFLMLQDITAVDWATRKERFSVIYIMFSIPLNIRIRLKIAVEDGDPVDTVTSVWKGANWPEREVFDMYGIQFTGHPDLRRMYMPEEFEYHPLRKEFPLMGIPGSLPLPQK